DGWGGGVRARGTVAGVVEGWVLVAGGRTGITLSDALALVKADDDNRLGGLRLVLMSLSKDGEKLPSAPALGNKFRSLRDRVLGGRRLVSETESSTNVQRWRVEEVEV